MLRKPKAKIKIMQHCCRGEENKVEGPSQDRGCKESWSERLARDNKPVKRDNWALAWKSQKHTPRSRSKVHPTWI